MKKIALTNGRFALIDDENLEEFSKFKWYYHSGGYAQTRKGLERILMHRMVMRNPNGEVDHKNGNRLDNRKSNLRVCTRTQNSFNSTSHSDSTSKYKGVSYDKSRVRWTACLRANGVEVLHKRFKTEEEAAKEYNTQATIYHGEFAKLNQA